MHPILVALLLCPTCTQMHAQRAIHSATRLADGRVLIAGGMVHNHAVLTTAELYDPTTGAFIATGAMPAERMSHSATLLKDGRVLLAGGYSGDGRIYQSALLYDEKPGSSRGLATCPFRVPSIAQRYSPTAGCWSLAARMVPLKSPLAAPRYMILRPGDLLRRAT